MRLIPCLLIPLLGVLAQPACASAPVPAGGNAASEPVQIQSEPEARAGQPAAEHIGGVHAAMLRVATEAQKEHDKRAGRHSGHAAREHCPDKADNRPTHSANSSYASPNFASPNFASDAREIDCIHCADRPATA